MKACVNSHTFEWTTKSDTPQLHHLPNVSNQFYVFHTEQIFQMIPHSIEFINLD